MLEIFSILLSIISFIIIFSFPINCYNSKSSVFKYRLNFFDIVLVNIILHLNFLLFLSFYSLNLNIIFTIYILVGLLLVLFNLIKYKDFFIKNLFFISLFLLILFCLFITIAQSAILTWDGAAHWFFKAQNFYQGNEYKDLKNLPFNYYPHLGPYIWAFFWKNSFLQLEYSGRFFFIFIFLVSIFSLGQQLNSKFSNIEKTILTFLFSYLSTNLFLFGGYQEYLIFFVFFSFSRLFFLSQYLKRNNFYDFTPAFLLLASHLVLWTKQEGFFYYIILNLIFLLHYKKNLYYKFVYLILSLVLLLIFIYTKIFFFGSLKFYETIIHADLINNFNLLILSKKIFLILKYIFISFAKYPIWILIILSSIILWIKYDFFNKNIFLYTFFFFSFSLVFLIFLQTTYELEWLLPLTLNRIVFPISAFFICLIVELLNRLKK
jgi:hypothetical protein